MVGVVESSWLPWGTPGSSGKLPAPVGFTEPTCPIPLDFLSFQGSWMSQSPACARKCCGKKHLNPHCISQKSGVLTPKWCTPQKSDALPQNQPCWI